MQFDIPAAQIHRAKFPHELFLTNLIGNHILWFVAALGMAGSFWQPLLVVPMVSLSTLLYTLWRARRARDRYDWFEMCHWQLAAKRSKVLLLVIGLCCLVFVGGWVGYSYLGMPRVVVMALSGGVGLLPTMVTVLVLIVMESDGLHQASHGRIPASLFRQYPNHQVVRLDSDEPQEGDDTEADHGDTRDALRP